MSSLLLIAGVWEVKGCILKPKFLRPYNTACYLHVNEVPRFGRKASMKPRGREAVSRFHFMPIYGQIRPYWHVPPVRAELASEASTLSRNGRKPPVPTRGAGSGVRLLGGAGRTDVWHGSGNMGIQPRGLDAAPDSETGHVGKGRRLRWG